MFKSFIFFLSNLLIKREYDVIFYYPCHFNRGKNGENLFFEPFFNICNDNNIKYLIIEEPMLNSKVNYFRNDKAIPFDFILILILVLRKFIKLNKHKSFQEREWYIAKILKVIFFRKFKFKNYVVLSKSLVGFFRGLDKYANLYDYQHGVITSTHDGYIKDKYVASDVKENNVNLLVYGNGFKNLLIKSTNEDYYETHTYVLGQSIISKYQNNYDKKVIFFALQFKDFTIKEHTKMLNYILEFLENIKEFCINNGFKIIMKHHPRFNQNISLEKIEKYSFVEIQNVDLFDLIKQSFCQVTFSSTTVFESASLGIPTFLIKNSDLPHEINPYFFEEDYNYYLKANTVDNIVEDIKNIFYDENKYIDLSNNVFEWYKSFYAEIDKNIFLNVIKGS